MSAPIQLSHMRHTGRLLPHRHTSYGGLFTLLGVVGWLMALVTFGIVAPGQAASGGIDVTAVVPGPPPAGAPTITGPTSGVTVHGATATVSGTCDSSLGYTVALSDNGTDRGSAFCNQDGFSIEASLLPGANTLTVHYVDSLGQSGPASGPVTVTYTSVGPTASALPAASGQVQSPSEPATPASTTSGSEASAPALTVPDHFAAINPGGSFRLSGTISSGAAPYAVEINWGDRSQTLFSQAAAGPFTRSHTFNQAGRFVILTSVSDVVGRVVVMQSTLTVNGAPAGASLAPTQPTLTVPTNELKIVWPAFLATCLVVVSFWLGERYDRRRGRSPLPSTG